MRRKFPDRRGLPASHDQSHRRPAAQSDGGRQPDDGAIAIRESVTVTGRAPLIDTTRVESGQHRPAPDAGASVNGRNWVDPGAAAARQPRNSVSEVRSRARHDRAVPGSTDGQRVAHHGDDLRSAPLQPRRDREFEFVSNRFDASQGHSSGVQVNAITKSGTNTLGGSFSGYFRSDKFNAADPVAQSVLPYSDQQLSVTFGGPIIKDRFHYFGSFEYEREPQTYLYNTPYPHFNGSLTGTRTERKEIARFDYQFSPKTRLTVRGTRYDNLLPYDPRYTGGSDRTMASAIGTNRRSEQELATLTRVLGARAVNEIKAGHDVFHWNQYSHTTNQDSLRA
jgi:hypothetical protein